MFSTFLDSFFRNHALERERVQSVDLAESYCDERFSGSNLLGNSASFRTEMTNRKIRLVKSILILLIYSMRSEFAMISRTSYRAVEDFSSLESVSSCNMSSKIVAEIEKFSVFMQLRQFKKT